MNPSKISNFISHLNSIKMSKQETSKRNSRNVLKVIVVAIQAVNPLKRTMQVITVNPNVSPLLLCKRQFLITPRSSHFKCNGESLFIRYSSHSHLSQNEKSQRLVKALSRFYSFVPTLHAPIV